MPAFQLRQEVQTHPCSGSVPPFSQGFQLVPKITLGNFTRRSSSQDSVSGPRDASTPGDASPPASSGKPQGILTSPTLGLTTSP